MSRLSALYKTIDGKLVKRNSWAERNPEKKRACNRESLLKYRQHRQAKEKAYQKELRELSKEIGNCIACHKPKEKSNFWVCLKCRTRMKKYLKSYRRKNEFK